MFSSTGLDSKGMKSSEWAKWLQPPKKTVESLRLQLIGTVGSLPLCKEVHAVPLYKAFSSAPGDALPSIRANASAVMSSQEAEEPEATT